MTRSAVNYLLFNSNKKVTKSPSSTPHSTSPTSAVLFHPPRNPLQLLRPPPHSKNTDSLPPNLIYNLLVASTSLLKPSFTTILSEFVDAGTPPLCVVADFFFRWSAAVSYEFGIFHVIFSGFGLGCYYSSWINLPHKNCEFILPDFQEADCEVWSQNTASKLKMAVSKVASDSIHYNPSDLSSWLESMICELNPAVQPLDDSFVNGTVTPVGTQLGVDDLKAIPGNASYPPTKKQKPSSPSSGASLMACAEIKKGFYKTH
ncbi:hypothetical protein L6452_32666 [Arctium lappa]|uniref:Uncharacterized protein n=1 Tax=Arctium lappa TaxID=4217 RepID=A0ACB8Z4C0_ARCLA|nr:hypothetical protein L6452_32666 [Arctium lappa]